MQKIEQLKDLDSIKQKIHPLALEAFLKGLGDVYHPVGAPYLLAKEGTHLSIDLLLYHKKLQSFLAIVLKTGTFSPAIHGQMGHVHPALGKLSVTSLERFLKKFPKKT